MRAPLIFGLLATFGRWNAVAVAPPGEQKPLGGGEAASHNPFNPEFDQFVADLLERWHVPGVAIAVVDGEKTYTKGYGFANVSAKTAVSPDTLFYAGSTTKAFTAASIAQLIDAGTYRNPSFPGRVVDWKTPIADILRDDFVLEDAWSTSHLTLEDALSHRTGLARHDWSTARHYDGHEATVRDITRSLRHLPLAEPPRTTFQYCNLMYVVASHAVEILTNRWLGDVLKDWIWQPLGMNQTFFALEDARKAGADVAAGYYWDAKKAAYVEVRYMPMSEVSGAGSVLSNAKDYAKWIRSLIDGTGPLSPAVHEEIKKPRILESNNAGYFDAPPLYTLGWDTTTYKGHQRWSHNGGTDSFGTEVNFFPGLKYGVVTFANTALSSNVIGEILNYKLIDDRLGVSPEKRGKREEDWVEKMRQLHDRVFDAPDILFPHRADPAQKPSLPLDGYVGTYFHPAYLNLTITAAGSHPLLMPKAELRMVREDFTWPMIGEFEHVTGEYWIMYGYFVHVPIDARVEFSPVRFQLGPDGKVLSFEIEWGNAPMGKGDGVIRFDKIE